MNINIILLGKLKERCFLNVMEEYLKRFPKSWDVRYLEWKKIPEKDKKERAFYVLLDEKGEEFSSRELASNLSKWGEKGKINFFIGGAYGFSENDYKLSDKMLSLSKLTFPHSVVPLIFVEQIYRAYTILNNHPYHH